MKRAIKASIAALAFVPALGFAMSAPAGADGETNVNLNPNHCGVQVYGGTGVCYFFARPDFDSKLFVQELSGAPGATATATLRCNGTTLAGAHATSGTTASSPPQNTTTWSNSGGICELRVVATGGIGTNTVQGWTWP